MEFALKIIDGKTLTVSNIDLKETESCIKFEKLSE